MKKVYILLAISAVIASTGYFLMKDNSNSEHVFSKGFNMINKNNSATSAEDMTQQAATETPVVEELKGCEFALEKLEINVDCLEKEISYADKKSAIVYLKGHEKENIIVLPDGRIVYLNTHFYFNGSESIKNYVKEKDGIDLTDEDIKNTVESLRIGKRGYLYGITFNGSYTGTIYITPKGRISGHLKI